MTKGVAQDTFTAKAPVIMAKLIGDFPIGPEDAAAIVGNLGHECNGFTTLQEIKPVVKGSRGGYGWAQWTGPRRKAYEAYCKRNDLDASGDKANYAFLFLELKGSEKKAIPAVKAAKTLSEKVIAFEKAFLRAGVKHYPSRQQWARIALLAWNEYQEAQKAAPATPKPQPQPQPNGANPGAPSDEVNRGAAGKALLALLGAIALAIGGALASCSGSSNTEPAAISLPAQGS